MASTKVKQSGEKTVQNIVIGVYSNGIQESQGSYLNRALERFQKNFLRAHDRTNIVNVAFVYGDKMVYARDFSEYKKEEILYLESCVEPPRLSHIWFMGMALLERKVKQDLKDHVNSQNAFYLFTDKKFDRMESQKILAAARFQEFDKNLYLIKTKDSAGGALEQYIAAHGKVYMEDMEF